MRSLFVTILLVLAPAGAAAEPWLDIFAVDEAESLRVEVADLLPEDAALALEDAGSPEAPRGTLTVIDAAGAGAVYPLLWDPLAGRLSAVFPVTEPPFLVGAAIRVDGATVFVPGTGFREFPGDED